MLISLLQIALVVISRWNVKLMYIAIEINYLRQIVPVFDPEGRRDIMDEA